VDAENWGAKLEKWGRCQLAIFYVLLALSSQLLSVSEVGYHEHTFAFSGMSAMT